MHNVCAICEERFTEWSAYAAHKMASRCFKKILPVRTTSRTKTQIITDWESRQERGLMKSITIGLLALSLTGAAYASDVITTTNASEAQYGDILWYSDPTPGHPTATYALPSSVPGLTGAQGATGAAGQDGTNGTNGKDGKNGLNGVNGKDAVVPAVDPRMDVEVREFDSKHWSMASYASFGFQTGTSRYIVGQKLTLKLGKSYEQKMIEKLQKQLSGNNVIVLPEN